MKRSLLLNSNGEPLQFINEVRAIKLMLSGRADPQSGLTGKPAYWDDEYTSCSYNFKLPAVLRLKNYVVRKGIRRPPRFQKRVLFNRDSWCCQYCGIELTYQGITVDHVVPVCKGGPTSWYNCVAACKMCNRKKGGKSLEESGMHLSKKPTEPSALHFWDLSKSSVWHDDWSMFVRI
jgi:hypothetical protein